MCMACMYSQHNINSMYTCVSVCIVQANLEETASRKNSRNDLVKCRVQQYDSVVVPCTLTTLQSNTMILLYTTTVILVYDIVVASFAFLCSSIQ